MTFSEMVNDAEMDGQIFDELGQSKCQPVLDAIGEREWSGSAADWELIRATAAEMDG